MEQVHRIFKKYIDLRKITNLEQFIKFKKIIDLKKMFTYLQTIHRASKNKNKETENEKEEKKKEKGTGPIKEERNES